MQTIHYSISDKKALSTPDKPVLVAGESGTSEIVLSTVPAAWEGFEVRALLTTPTRILVDALAVGSGFLLTNTMLDAQGYLYIEFAAYRNGTEIDRSLPDKLYVNAGRKELGDIDPAPLPDLVAEMVAAKDGCDEAAQGANNAAASCAELDAEIEAAEAIRQSAEIFRGTNESGRVAAENVRAGFYEGFDAGLTDIATKTVLPVSQGGIINIATPDGNLDVTHPSVVHVPAKWNGHQYWMAITGMPDARENPMIFRSDDGANWVAPDGLTNPVFPLSWCQAKGYAYSSDTSLTLVNGEMWMLWRTVDNVGFREAIWLSKSTDGVIWSNPSDPLYIVTTSTYVRSALSPSLVVLPGTGHLAIFDVKYPETTATTEPPSEVRKRVSTDGGVTWSTPTTCSTPSLHHSYPTLANLWHLEVRLHGGHLHMLGYAQTQRLYYWESLDGGATWFGSRSPIFGDDHSETRLFYRSSFQPSATGDGWDIWAADWPAKRVRIFRNIDSKAGTSDMRLDRGIWLPAEHLSASVGGLTTLLGSGNGRLMGWRLAENALGRVSGSFIRPVGWRKLRATLYWINDGVNSGDVYFESAFASYQIGEVPATLGIANDIRGTDRIVTAGIQGAIMRTVMSVPGADSFPGEFTAILISRTGTKASDTLENRILLLGALIEPC